MEAPRLLKIILPVLLALGLQSCYYLQSAQAPIRTLSYPIASETSGGRAAKDLLILLPGIRDYPEAFEKHRFIDAINQSGVAMDVLAVDAHYRYYAKRNLLDRLKEDVVEPSFAKGYQRLHFAGISLGGYGALLYMREYPEDVSSVLLLAPYLGEPEHYAHLLDPSTPPAASVLEDEANIWPWLKTLSYSQRLKIFLGYGRSDSYAVSHNILANLLPSGQVKVIDGEHRWTTWQLLWPQLLASAGFSDSLVLYSEQP